jgi:male germ cell-associated kinase
LESKYH